MRGKAAVRSGWLDLAVALLAAGVVVAVPVLALQGMWANLARLTEPSAQGQASPATGYLTAAFIVGTAGSLVGIAATTCTGRPGLRWLFAIVLVLTLIVAGLGRVDDARTERGRTPPAPRPSVCQEYSGGDTHCPGG